MDESIKIEELFRTYPSSDTDGSIVTFFGRFRCLFERDEDSTNKKATYHE